MLGISINDNYMAYKDGWRIVNVYKADSLIRVIEEHYLHINLTEIVYKEYSGSFGTVENSFHIPHFLVSLIILGIGV